MKFTGLRMMRWALEVKGARLSCVGLSCVGLAGVMMTGLLLAGSGPAAAHQCQLEGTSAEDISRYNTCKADMSVPNIHQSGDEAGLQRDIDRLEAENALLSAQLERVRRHILAILGEL